MNDTPETDALVRQFVMHKGAGSRIETVEQLIVNKAFFKSKELESERDRYKRERDELARALQELYAIVRRECPSLFTEYSREDAQLAIKINTLLSTLKD